MCKEKAGVADRQREKNHVEAGEWFCRLRERPHDPDLLAQFERWKAKDLDREACYLELLLIWDEMGDLPEPDPSVDRAAVPQTPRLTWGRAWATACLVAVVCVLAWFVPQHYALLDADYVTAVGETRQIELADGSVMHLNGQSAVAVDYGSDERTLRLLRGEAFFEVSKDPQRPFRVQAGDTRTDALGTAFNIRMVAERVETTLTEGRVSVHTSGKPVFMRAGQRLIWQPGRPPQVTDGSHAYLPAWKRGLLRIDRRPLKEVVELLNRHYHPTIRVVDPALWDAPVSGTLPLNDLQTVLVLLQESMSVRHSALGERLLLLHR